MLKINKKSKHNIINQMEVNATMSNLKGVYVIIPLTFSYDDFVGKKLTWAAFSI